MLLRLPELALLDRDLRVVVLRRAFGKMHSLYMFNFFYTFDFGSELHFCFCQHSVLLKIGKTEGLVEVWSRFLFFPVLSSNAFKTLRYSF